MATPTINDIQGKDEAPAGFKPYVPDQVRMPEFTVSAVVLGKAAAVCPSGLTPQERSPR